MEGMKAAMGCEFPQMRPSDRPSRVPFSLRTPFAASRGAARENLTDDGAVALEFNLSPSKSCNCHAASERGFSLRPPAEKVVHYSAGENWSNVAKNGGRRAMPTATALTLVSTFTEDDQLLTKIKEIKR